MEKIFEQFGIQPILLAAQIVNFLVLLFILNKLMYKPVLKILKDRKDKIAASLKNAEEIDLKLQKTEEESENRLQKASQEAQKIIDETKKSAQEIIAQAHTKAQSDINEMLKKGQDQINLEREKMNQEVRDELSKIVEISLEKVAGKILTTKDQKELIDKSVKQI